MNQQTETQTTTYAPDHNVTDALILIERTLAFVALDYANGEGMHKYTGFYPADSDEPWEAITDHYTQWAIDEITNQLGTVPLGFFVDWDPRGYKLKVQPEQAAGMRTDWGGYGILAWDAYDDEHGGTI